MWRRNGPARTLVEHVCERREEFRPLVDGIDYGPAQWAPDEWVGGVEYYWFLAGVAQVSGSTRAFEAGTHFGGAALALAAGGAHVMTCDIAADGLAALAEDPRIQALHTDAVQGAARCRHQWGSVDLVFVDVDHEAATTLAAIDAALTLSPRWLLIDDTRLSPAMEHVWRKVARRFGKKNCFDVDDAYPEVRNGAGLGVVKVR